MSSHHSDDDEGDSLFGSPPPSPGRSPSPALALPGRSVNASGSTVSAFTKNVGTIALPGSQPSSELLLNPLASSLSLPTAAPRPPALSSRALNVETPSLPHHHRHYRTPSQSTADVSTSAQPKSLQPKTTPTPKPQSRKKKRKTSETPRSQVQIPLPDPSEPLPANFLRSQTALLGAAGLVARVKPANLVHNHFRGTTPSNPIVVEEEEPKPTTRRSAPPAAHLQKGGTVTSEVSLPKVTVDKSLLQMPSKQDILAALVKEKDVFPILQSLIKITAPALPQHPGPSSRSSWGQGECEASTKKGPRSEVIGTHATGYPMKKRKLNRVPAGAVDWDIPYPFAHGEGPDAYRQTWKDERKKELIAQLLGLIKSATTKAAMINYYKKKAHRDGKARSRADKGKAKEAHDRSRSEEGPNINKYYKPITATYGVPPPVPRATTAPSSSSCVSSRQSTPAHDHHSSMVFYPPSRSLTPTSTAPSELALSSAATTPGPESPTTNEDPSSLDLLISSLLAMSQDQTSVGQVSVPPPQNPITSTLPLSPSTSASANGGGAATNDFSNLFGVDQGWFDEWMKSLDGCTATTTNSAATLDFGDISSIIPQQHQHHPQPSSELLPCGSLAANPTSTPISSSTATATGNLPAMDFDFSAFDFSIPIDPELLALSSGLSTTSTGNNDHGSSAMNASHAAAFSATPAAPSTTSNPSSSSLSSSEAATAEWDMSILDDIFSAPPNNLPPAPVQAEGLADVNLESLAGLVAPAPGEGTPTPTTTGVVGLDCDQVMSPTAGHGSVPASLPIPPALPSSTGDAMCVDGAGESVASSAPQQGSSESVVVPPLEIPVSSSRRPSSSPNQPVEAPQQQQQQQRKQKSNLQLEKEEVVRRAKERKAVLEAELKKVKLQLWECTIEQGGLHHVLGHYQEQEKERKRKLAVTECGEGDGGEEGEVDVDMSVSLTG